MTTARASQVDIDTTPFYHCIARCVRQAFLCGSDVHSGRNFDHRKAWVLERLALLAEAFAIDVCAYAIMCNHVHLVLHVDRERAAQWPQAEVVRRVGLLFPKALSGVAGEEGQQRAQGAEKITLWRERLSDLSWFMRCLNEFIARRANKEDGCKGRFWEGRFKSQALLDDGAVLACMSYVDLNPVRAGLARGLDDSEWTSIKQRLREAAATLRHQEQSNLITAQQQSSAAAATASVCTVALSMESDTMEDGTPLVAGKLSGAVETGVRLAPLVMDVGGHQAATNRGPVNISLVDYIELLEWTGRKIHPRKRGRIKVGQPPARLLSQCQISAQSWVETLENFHGFASLVGAPHVIRNAASKLNRHWVKGQVRARAMYWRVAPR